MKQPAEHVPTASQTTPTPQLVPTCAGVAEGMHTGAPLPQTMLAR